MEEKLIDLYRKCSPDFLENFSKLHKNDYLSLEAQEYFFKKIYKEELVQKYPLPSRYIKRIFKKYYEEIEYKGEEGVLESLMETYFGIINSTESTNNSYSQRALEVSHRIYSYENDGDLVIRVWPEFSQVGLAMWPAGWYICELILKNREIFKNKNVLELGSGVGLTGIVLRKYCETKNIYMTDYLDTVLKNCEKNNEINNVKDINVCKLDWEKVSKEEIENYNIDIILAADVLYDVTVIEKLTQVVFSFMNFNKSIICYFVVTERNEKTFEFFKLKCEENHLNVEDVTNKFDTIDFFDYEKKNIKFVELKKK
eukprot:gene11893-5299_t